MPQDFGWNATIPDVSFNSKCESRLSQQCEATKLKLASNEMMALNSGFAIKLQCQLLLGQRTIAQTFAAYRFYSYSYMIC